MSADDEPEEAEPPTDLVLDPCEPGILPGGPGRRVVCGRMRVAVGTHVLDTGGASGP